MFRRAIEDEVVNMLKPGVVSRTQASIILYEIFGANGYQDHPKQEAAARDEEILFSFEVEKTCYCCSNPIANDEDVCRLS